MNTSAINILVFRSCVKVILQLHVQTFKHVLSYFGSGAAYSCPVEE